MVQLVAEDVDLVGPSFSEFLELLQLLIEISVGSCILAKAWELAQDALEVVDRGVVAVKERLVEACDLVAIRLVLGQPLRLCELKGCVEVAQLSISISEPFNDK